nr:MAG TPA: 43 kDa tail protein [Bacteriophage sp.]
MLPGPSVATIAGGVAVGARVSVHRGKTTTIQDLPVWDVTVDATVERNVQRQVSFTCSSEHVPSNPLDPLNNYGHRVHVWQVVETPAGKRSEVDLGWFLVESWEEQPDEGTMTVEAVDLLRLVETDVAAWPSSPPKNQTLSAEVQRLAGKTLAVVFSGKSNPKVDSELQFQTDRLANLADLCAAYSLGFRMRPDGYLHVYPFTSDIVGTYSAADLIVDAPRESVERKPNRFLAVGSKSEGQNKETKWSFEAKTTTEPFGASYGVVRERIEVQSATNQKMVTAAANDALKKNISVLGFRSFEIVPDSRIELGDVLMLKAPDRNVKGRVHAFSLPVDTTDLMRVDVEIIG